MLDTAIGIRLLVQKFFNFGDKHACLKMIATRYINVKISKLLHSMHTPYALLWPVGVISL